MLALVPDCFPGLKDAQKLIKFSGGCTPGPLPQLDCKKIIDNIEAKWIKIKNSKIYISVAFILQIVSINLIIFWIT